jgi:CheY-like chemotaxis protein
MSRANVAYIVDDDPIYVYSLKKLIALRSFCSQVISFPNGADALQGLKDANASGLGLPQIVLLDINMPVMDGWDFLKEFEKLYPTLIAEVTLYMVSSSPDDRDVKRAMATGLVKNYMAKPMTLSRLAEIFDDPVAA